MANNLPDAIENELLDALVGTDTFSVTTPIKVALMTVNGDGTTPGTEVSGGSYARQVVAFTAASGGVIDNDDPVEFTNMPACTVVGIELYDNAGTPKRIAFGETTESKVLSAGDTLRFATGTLTFTLS
jgi:hypothetical protein